MAVTKGEYRIVGRYMSGAEVNGYHLVSDKTGEGHRFSREQVILLVGRGQVSNCNASLSGDTVALTGIGCELSKLPVKQEAKASNTQSIAGTNETIHGLYLDKQIVHGVDTVGYVVRHTNGAVKNLTTSHVLNLLQDNKIVNAKVGTKNGSYILMDNNGNELVLPAISATQLGLGISNGNIRVDNNTIKDSKIGAFKSVQTANGEVKSIPVYDNISKQEYRENQAWIDNMINLLKKHYISESQDMQSGLDGRFINPEIRVTSNPGSSKPIVIMKFNIHYTGLRDNLKSSTFARMAFSVENNNGVCVVQIPKFADAGDIVATKIKTTADDEGIADSWREVSKRMLQLKMMGFDDTISAGESATGFMKSVMGVFN